MYLSHHTSDPSKNWFLHKFYIFHNNILFNETMFDVLRQIFVSRTYFVPENIFISATFFLYLQAPGTNTGGLDSRRRRGLDEVLVTWTSELGKRQLCRDNVTMLSGHKVVCNCHFTIFIVATPSRHWGLTIFRFFAGPWPVPEAILRCREAKNFSPAQLWIYPLYNFIFLRHCSATGHCLPSPHVGWANLIFNVRPPNKVRI